MQRFWQGFFAGAGLYITGRVVASLLRDWLGVGKFLTSITGGTA